MPTAVVVAIGELVLTEAFVKFVIGAVASFALSPAFDKRPST